MHWSHTYVNMYTLLHLIDYKIRKNLEEGKDPTTLSSCTPHPSFPQNPRLMSVKLPMKCKMCVKFVAKAGVSLWQLSKHLPDGDSNSAGKLFSGVWFVERRNVDKRRAAAIQVQWCEINEVAQIPETKSETVRWESSGQSQDDSTIFWHSLTEKNLKFHHHFLSLTKTEPLLFHEYPPNQKKKKKKKKKRRKNIPQLTFLDPGIQCSPPHIQISARLPWLSSCPAGRRYSTEHRARSTRHQDTRRSHRTYHSRHYEPAAPASTLSQSLKLLRAPWAVKKRHHMGIHTGEELECVPNWVAIHFNGNSFAQFRTDGP